MTRTPDEIKKGLECCKLHDGDMYTDCSHCPYYLTSAQCDLKMHSDALTLIQQLQAETAEKDEKIQQLEAERDAAVALIPHVCAYCKWYGTKHGGFFPDCKNPSGCKNVSGINTGWEWRGVQKEE